MNGPDPTKVPLCSYFLSGYWEAHPDDEQNFPADQCPEVFDRYEILFHDALVHLNITKEELRARQEFTFDSGDANNLEGALGVLRAAIHLGQAGFTEIMLIKARQTSPGADLTARKNGRKVCFEVKTITKRSTGREGYFFADQLYEKIKEGIPRARAQLLSSSATLSCDLAIYVCVVNWLPQAIYLGQEDYQQIVNLLEEHGQEKSLEGIDGVWFILKSGHLRAFLNERAHVIDT